MIEVIKQIIMAFGTCVVAVTIYGLLCATINKFNKWRKSGCKIKCLCKPHKYRLFARLNIHAGIAKGYAVDSHF